MPCLEDLVPDIIVLLLLESPNVSSLWAFSRVSPRTYGIFLNYRDIILTNVIVHEIGHEILYEATSALDSTRFESRGLPKQQALDWIAKYRSGATGSTYSLSLSFKSEVLPLWRLHQDVKYFARLYVSDRFGAMGSKKYFDDDDWGWDVNAVSDIETLRIYRGIYRFAIFGNLFYQDPKRNQSRERGPKFLLSDEQSHSFLNLYSAWEVEEISCINDFMVDRIRMKWQEVEDEYYNILKDEPSKWDIDRPIGPSRWDFDIFSSSAKIHYESWQDYSISFSLPELREMLTAKGEESHKILESTRCHLYESPLNDALKESYTIRFERDALDQPNEAWLWAHDNQPCELYVDSTWEFPIGEGLRRWGYVFWDSDRLHGSYMLDEEPETISKNTLKSNPRPIVREDESVESRIRKLAHWQRPIPESEKWSSEICGDLPFALELQ